MGGGKANFGGKLPHACAQSFLGLLFATGTQPQTEQGTETEKYDECEQADNVDREVFHTEVKSLEDDLPRPWAGYVGAGASDITVDNRAPLVD